MRPYIKWFTKSKIDHLHLSREIYCLAGCITLLPTMLSPLPITFCHLSPHESSCHWEWSVKPVCYGPQLGHPQVVWLWVLSTLGNLSFLTPKHCLFLLETWGLFLQFSFHVCIQNFEVIFTHWEYSVVPLWCTWLESCSLSTLVTIISRFSLWLQGFLFY